MTRVAARLEHPVTTACRAADHSTRLHRRFHVAGDRRQHCAI